MHAVLLVIHLFLALAIIGLVLLQRSEGGGLGIGGGGGGLGGVSTPQGAANMLSRATGICAAAFFCTSLLLGIMAGHNSGPRDGLLEGVSTMPAAQEAVVNNGDEAAPSASDAVDAAADNNEDNQNNEAPAAPVAE